MDISEYNIDGAEFEKLLYEEEKPPIVLTEWSSHALGQLCFSLEKLSSENTGHRYLRRHASSKITAKTIISLANRVFGFNGWSIEVVRADVLSETFEDDLFSADFAVEVRITLKDGLQVCQQGRARVKNMPKKASCFRLGKKKAMADGLKRAVMELRTLFLENEGNVGSIKNEVG